MKPLGAILLWSAISAAFIGPGTVATAAAAGATTNLSLLWTLVFSIIACLSLQEAAARLTAITGLDLGQAMRKQYGRMVPWAVVTAVVVGCTAYEAGNVLGAVSGARLVLDLPQKIWTLITGILVLSLLWAGGPKRVAKLIGLCVAVMGIAFLVCAVLLNPDWKSLLKGCLLPSFHEGSGTLVLALIGTTVVPYNLFLGSGLARSQKLSEIRLGLGVAVPLGGIISGAILVTGTTLSGDFEFSALAGTLGGKLGSWASLLFALGLFAAGLSSAVTAPLAAAMSVRSLQTERVKTNQDNGSLKYRSVWLMVAVIGLGFGLAEFKPIPVIILAQALNGILLPLVAIFLLIATNDRSLLGKKGINGITANLAMGFSCLVAMLLGLSGLLRAIAHLCNLPAVRQGWLLLAASILALMLAFPIVRRIRKGRISALCLQESRH